MSDVIHVQKVRLDYLNALTLCRQHVSKDCCVAIYNRLRLTEVNCPLCLVELPQWNFWPKSKR